MTRRSKSCDVLHQGITQLQTHADPVSVKHSERFSFRIEGTRASRSFSDIQVPYMLRNI